MSSDRHTIINTHTDEAPALATRSLLPVVNAFTRVAGVQVELRDISLSGRVLAAFPEALTAEQRVSDDLAELGDLVTRPEANVIKLPNVSASLPQLKATIDELRAKGYALPDYPDEPSTREEEDVQARYDRIKGSAVNPVLREGNSDRRAPASVKNYARSHPHKMGAWAKDSKTSVATMGHDDFRSNERSVTFADADDLKVELVAADGTVTAFDAPALGPAAGDLPAAPVVGIASTADGNGVWEVTRDGAVFAYGDAGFRGPVGQLQPAAPIEGIAADAPTGGYWMVGADGGVYCFGAGFYGAG